MLKKIVLWFWCSVMFFWAFVFGVFLWLIFADTERALATIPVDNWLGWYGIGLCSGFSFLAVCYVLMDVVIDKVFNKCKKTQKQGYDKDDSKKA